MSSNISRGNKTITGEDTLEVDEINIVGDGIGFNGNFGTAGQVIKKSSIDNSIGWLDEQTFTATLPIVLQNGQISFDTGGPETTKIKMNIFNTGGLQTKILTIGTTITLQEHNGLALFGIVDAPTINADGTLNIRDPNNAYSTEVVINKNEFLPATGNTNYVIGSSNFPINEIVSNTNNCKVELIVGDISSGNTIDITSNGLSGYSNHQIGAHINNFNTIPLHSNSPSPDFVGIDTNGRGIYTRAGNINLLHNTTYGQIVRTGEITGKAGSDRYSLTSGAILNDFGNITARRFVGDIYHFNNMTDTTIGTTKLTISGNSNNINGDGSTTITNIASIHASTINNSTTNSVNINVSQHLDVSGVITGTDTAIFTGGFKQASGGGNFTLNTQGDLSVNSIVASSIQAGSQTITGDISMSNNDILCKAIGITGGANSGIDMNDADITEIGNLSMNDNLSVLNMNGGNINMNNGEITNCNNISVSDIDLTNQLSISQNVDIRWADDTDLTTKYSCNFVISTEAHPTGQGAFEREFWNECWMVGNRYEGFGTQLPFSPATADSNGNLCGIRQTGTGKSTGGFDLYPHFLFTGEYPPGPAGYTERQLVSKIFPVDAFRDVVKIQFRVIGGNNSNGGESLDSDTRLFLCWDSGSGGKHRTYNIPQSPLTETSGNYFHRLYTNANGNTISNFTTLSLITTSYDGSVVPNFTSTQLTNFRNARSFMLYNVNDGDMSEIGITDFKMFSVNQKNGLLTNNIDKVSKINDKYMTGNCYRNGSIYGALSYYGLNYCNGWYYEELDMSKWIADDDSSSPSSLMVREPPASYSGTTNNTGGFVCLSNHTQIYYCFNCPPGYRVVGYFISLKGNSGAITNPTLANSSFYNHLIEVDNFGQSTETGNTTSKSFLVSESTDSVGTPHGSTTTGISYRSFNVEIPVQTNHTLIGTDSHKILSNGFPINIEEYGSRNQLRADKKYKIMCFRSARWSNAFIFTGGYIKYQKWDGETK